MATKLATMVIYLVRLFVIKSRSVIKSRTRSLARSRDKKPLYISIIRVPMANTLSTMMTLLDGLLTIMSYHPLIKWPF